MSAMGGNDTGELIKRILAIWHKDKVLETFKARQILSLTTTASETEVKKAYHKLVMKVHPDKCPEHENAKDAFDAVNKSHEILREAAKKAAPRGYTAAPPRHPPPHAPPQAAQPQPPRPGTAQKRTRTFHSRSPTVLDGQRAVGSWVHADDALGQHRAHVPRSHSKAPPQPRQS